MSSEAGAPREELSTHLAGGRGQTEGLGDGGAGQAPSLPHAKEVSQQMPASGGNEGRRCALREKTAGHTCEKRQDVFYLRYCSGGQRIQSGISPAPHMAEKLGMGSQRD